MNTQEFIRNNNRLWSLLYYSELIEQQHYQLTYCAGTNEEFYNCAQAVTQLTDADLKHIENYYQSRHLKPCFYTDPDSENWLIPFLPKNGYAEVKAQCEYWWLLSLSEEIIKELRQPCALKNSAHNIECNTIRDSLALDQFLNIDGVTNQLSAAVMKILTANIKNKKNPDILLEHFLGYVDHQPAFCGSIGIINNCGFLAEGGTLRAYQCQGLHTYMTKCRIIYAYEHDVKYVWATTSTSSNAIHTLEKLNFKRIFSRHLFKKI